MNPRTLKHPVFILVARMIVVTSYNNRHVHVTRGAACLVLHGICRPRSGSLGRVAAKQRSGVSFFYARNITSVLFFIWVVESLNVKCKLFMSCVLITTAVLKKKYTR